MYEQKNTIEMSDERVKRILMSDKAEVLIARCGEGPIATRIEKMGDENLAAHLLLSDETLHEKKFKRDFFEYEVARVIKDEKIAVRILKKQLVCTLAQYPLVGTVSDSKLSAELLLAQKTMVRLSRDSQTVVISHNTPLIEEDALAAKLAGQVDDPKTCAKILGSKCLNRLKNSFLGTLFEGERTAFIKKHLNGWEPGNTSFRMALKIHDHTDLAVQALCDNPTMHEKAKDYFIENVVQSEDGAAKVIRASKGIVETPSGKIVEHISLTHIQMAKLCNLIKSQETSAELIPYSFGAGAITLAMNVTDENLAAKAFSKNPFMEQPVRTELLRKIKSEEPSALVLCIPDIGENNDVARLMENIRTPEVAERIYRAGTRNERIDLMRIGLLVNDQAIIAEIVMHPNVGNENVDELTGNTKLWYDRLLDRLTNEIVFGGPISSRTVHPSIKNHLVRKVKTEELFYTMLTDNDLAQIPETEEYAASQLRDEKFANGVLRAGVIESDEALVHLVKIGTDPEAAAVTLKKKGDRWTLFNQVFLADIVSGSYAISQNILLNDIPICEEAKRRLRNSKPK